MSGLIVTAPLGHWDRVWVGFTENISSWIDWGEKRMGVMYNFWLKHAHKRKEVKQLVFYGQ